MQLVIDIGNTNSKWAIFENGAISTHGSFENNNVLPEAFTSLKSSTPVIICSVSGISDQLSMALKKFSDVLEFNAETPLPIKMEYKSPETLGLDRIANAVAAFYKFPERNVLVIDAGTCITLDLLDEHGVYQGGSISPGLNMRLSALNNYTSALPLVEISTPEFLVGRNTEQSILSGVVNGVTAEIMGLMELYSKEFKALQVVITGGDHFWFGHPLKNKTFADAFFTLRGLHTILEYNRSHT